MEMEFEESSMKSYRGKVGDTPQKPTNLDLFSHNYRTSLYNVKNSVPCP